MKITNVNLFQKLYFFFTVDQSNIFIPVKIFSTVNKSKKNEIVRFVRNIKEKYICNKKYMYKNVNQTLNLFELFRNSQTTPRHFSLTA